MRKFLRDNSLSVTMFALFVVFTVGLAITGYRTANEELLAHGKPVAGFWKYLGSGEFLEAVFENWESEFLQMAALVVGTVFLRQKGSADSKRLSGKEDVDTSSRYSIIHAASWRNRGRALRKSVFAHSLGLSLFALFIISFILHAAGGAAAYNETAQLHGEAQYSALGYAMSSQFWFESFQNWQSEFLAVGTLLVLSIFLRERGSPESKPIGAPNAKTGE
jgi:hypothetical protein